MKVQPVSTSQRATRRTLIAAGCVLLATPAVLASAAPPACPAWPAWEGFATRFVADSGRLIDPSTPDDRTTSEGQSYALFFALVANDRKRFAEILRWTENNLAGGDLAARLPAWLWGRKAAADWSVIDANPASDADLWIAYALQEAGRLWQVPRYATLGQQLGERILQEETVQLNGLGRLLLPAPKGFQRDAGSARFNPSYMPLQLLRRLASGSRNEAAKAGWAEQERATLRLIIDSAPRGFVPDWVDYTVATGFAGAAESDGQILGSFNAIRTYLWAGMLAPDAPGRAPLLRALQPMAELAARTGQPPQRVDTRNGFSDGVGDAGFSAALLPLMAGTVGSSAVQQQRARIAARDPLSLRDNYYEQALTLFGLGWADGHYRFAADGMLQVRWTCSAR